MCSGETPDATLFCTSTCFRRRQTGCSRGVGEAMDGGPQSVKTAGEGWCLSEAAWWHPRLPPVFSPTFRALSFVRACDEASNYLFWPRFLFPSSLGIRRIPAHIVGRVFDRPIAYRRWCVLQYPTTVIPSISSCVLGLPCQQKTEAVKLRLLGVPCNTQGCLANSMRH